MSKKLLVAGVILTLMVTVFAGVAVSTASAQSVTCANISSMLTVLGITDAAKVAQANAALGCSAAASCAASFTRNLTVGSTGADVTALQTKLGVTPATGYFGAITKAAVVAYQTANGIAPAAGYVGPITLAKLNYCAPVTTTTTTTTTTTSGSATLSGGAGDITITKASDVESEVREGDSNVKIADFKVKAEDSDVGVTSVKVSLINNGSGSARLNRYAETVSVYEGSKKVGSADVADFTKDGDTYSKSISLTNATVNENAKVDFYVAVSAVGHIDGADGSNNWNVTVDQVRFTDGTGATLTADVPSTLSTTGEDFVFQTLAASGNVQMHISTVGPTAGDVLVSDTGTTNDVPLLFVTLRAEGSDMTFSKMKVALDSTGVTTDNLMVSNLRLVEGKGNDSGNEIDSETVGASADQTVTFTSSDDITIDEGTSKTYTIFGKIKQIGDTSASSTFDQGDSLTVSMSDPSVTSNFNIQDLNGDAADPAGSAPGENQVFKSQGVTVAVSSMPTPTVDAKDTTSSSDDTGNFVVNFSVTANDETVYIPLNTSRGASTGGVGYTIQDASAGSVATTGSVAGTVLEQVGSQGGVTFLDAACGGVDCLRINDGSTANLRVSAYYDPAASGSYRLQMNTVNFAITAIAPDVSNALVPVQDYRTASKQIGN